MPDTNTTNIAKPGYKTTEFWLSFAAVIVGAVQASGIVPAEGPWNQVLGMAISALVALGYTGARMAMKKGS
jgi:hypothetical protein